MEKKQTTGATMSAQDANIIKVIKEQAQKIRVDRGYYPHYSHKLGKLSAGFTIKPLKDGKPTTINKSADAAALNYLIIFITHESKKTKAKRKGFGGLSSGFLMFTQWDGATCRPVAVTGEDWRIVQRVWRVDDAETLRKIGDRFYLLTIGEQYSTQDKELQEQRRNNRPNPTTAERLKGAQPCQNEEQTQRGARYETKENGTRWGLTYSRHYLDASGYDLTTTRAALYRRARELRKQRAADKWNSTDHAETVRELEQIAQTIKAAAVEIFANSGDFYPLKMAESFRNAAQYVKETAEQIKGGKIEDIEDITKRIAHSHRLAKKCAILEPLANDRHAYGWTWWELTDSGELVNTYEGRTAGEYYDKITAQSVGIFENQTQGATL